MSNAANDSTQIVKIAPSSGQGFAVGKNQPLVLISGPCVIESKDHCLRMAETISTLARARGIPLIFKSSYDKANRTSSGSFRGMGIEEGLRVLEAVRDTHGLPVLTDVHSEEEARSAAEVVDVLQVPAFLCRQTDLLLAAGSGAKPILIKKGQFLHPADMRFAADKAISGGAPGVLLCERGACFGYRELVVDFRSLRIMNDLGFPVVFDGTHSVQVMGGAGGSSSGAREFVPLLVRAAVAAGVDALFLECHDEPDMAPSDGPNMLTPETLERVLDDVTRIREISFQSH